LAELPSPVSEAPISATITLAPGTGLHDRDLSPDAAAPGDHRDRGFDHARDRLSPDDPVALSGACQFVTPRENFGARRVTDAKTP